MEFREITRAAREQGWGLERTRHGLMFLSPDGRAKVLIHRRPTEQALKKALSQLKRGGLIWPWPPTRARRG